MSDDQTGDTRPYDIPTPLCVGPHVPKVVGNFEIHEQLGQGGMGTVYAARDVTSGKSVAVKFLLPKNSQDAEIRQRFMREARAGAMLNGPHIIPVIGMIEDETSLYLVMERIRGRNLREWMNEHKSREILWVISIARQIAQGLATAHAAGIVHRDIKPSNILLSEDGNTAYIGDFGLALLSNLSDGLTSTGRPMGTPHYMSPEQVRGLPTDRRTDLFSLGCVIYAMVSGESPFVASSVTASIWRIVEVDPPSLHSVDPRVTPLLSQIVSRLLQKVPDARFSSAEEVDEALGKCLDVDLNATYIYPDVPESTVRIPDRTRHVSSLLVASMVTIVCVVLVGSYYTSRPTPSKLNAPKTSEQAGKQTVPAKGDTPAARVAGMWTVARTGTPDFTPDFTSISAALKAAGPGDLITVVDDGKYSETVVIDEPVRLRGVRLISPKRATLGGSTANGRLATLTLHSTRDVTIEGFTVEGGSESHAIYVYGDVAGGMLRDMVITQSPGAQWANIMLARECRGTTESPLTIRACRIATAKYGLFSGREDVPDAMEASNIWLDGNEFYGDGTHVEFAHSARDVCMEFNVFRGGDGIVLRLNAPARSGNFRISNNSFFETRNWLKLDLAAEFYNGQAINNLLVAQQAPVWTPKLQHSTDHWRFGYNLVETQNMIELNEFGSCIVDAMLESRTPNEPGFLHPLPNSPVAMAGAGDGLPKYIGARVPRTD